MKIDQLRKKYIENKKLLDKLEKSNNKEDKNNVLKIQKEQLILIKNMKKSIYRNYSKKDFDNKIELKNNEIVYETNEISNIIKIEDISDIDDKTEVLKSNTDDNKTEVLKNKSILDDKKTNILRQNLIINRKLKDAKIIFDGTYKIIYNNGKDIYESSIDEVLLNHNIEEKQSIYNFNIIKMLKEFDEKNNSRLYFRYMTNDIDVIYDFDKIKKNQINEEIKKTKIIAKKEAKTFENVSINDNSIKRKIKRGLITAATFGTIALSLFGINKCNNRGNNTNNTPTITTEITNEAVNDNNTEITNEITTEGNTTKKEKKVKKENKKENKVETKEKIVKQEKETIKEEDTSLKIGDVISLDSIDLYHASTDLNPVGNTKFIGNGYKYKATLMSVVCQNEVMEVYKKPISINELKKVCKEKYGNDFKIFINFDLLDKKGNIITQYVGWVDFEDTKTLTLK